MTEPQIKASMVTLTPAMAEKLLARNTSNRSVRQHRVDQYAKDIRDGNWSVNGEAIKVAHTGQVLDGQHRLIAVLEADAPIQTLLITGLPREAQETMDQGLSRQLCDALKLRGEKDYNALAAAIKIVALYERDGVPFKAMGKSSPTIHEAMRTLERNPEIRASITAAARRKVRWMPYSTLAALHYLFATASQEDADDFLSKLLLGENLKSTDPIWLLRDRLMRDADNPRAGRLTAKAKLAFLIRTWNAYRTGDGFARLIWTGGGANPDRFPQIDGLASPDGLEQAA